ncbi:MAG: FmdB family zinc ribbon protein [Nitrospiraceae bacterium]
MPLYEYRCLDCKKRSTILVLNPANQAPVGCSHCMSAQMKRVLSRFASPKSEEARLEALADPSNLAGLDENDPKSMARLMKTMGEETGEDFGDDVLEAMESDETDSMGSDSTGRL